MTKNPMPISEDRKAEVGDAARPLINAYHTELTTKLDEILTKKLPRKEENNAIFLIIDSYQTAFVSMATHINTIRHSMGGETTMSVNMPLIPGVTDIKPNNFS